MADETAAVLLMVDVLRSELLRIDGVSEAIVSGLDSPESVRVVLSPDANVPVVELLVHEVLSAHGLLSEGDLESKQGSSLIAVGTIGGEVPNQLESLAVTEGVAWVTVTARSSAGDVATRPARPGAVGVAEAVVAVIAELSMPDQPCPALLVVRDEELDGSNVVTVLLDLGGGRRRAGAAMLDGGRAYGLAKAVWQALNG